MKKIKIFAILVCFLLLCSCGKATDTVGTDEFIESSSAVSEVSSDMSIFSQPESETNSNETVKNDKTIIQTTLNDTISNQIVNEYSSTEPITSVDTTNQNANNEYVTFSVDCKSAVNYGIRNNSSFSQVIPENGILLDNSNIEFSDGDSVMKLLKSVLKKNNISYQITSGGYVRSIGGLSEFDCGDGSGWLYTVNGQYPDVSCKSYLLKAGDIVKFIYSCG